jgi:hypothetical protein
VEVGWGNTTKAPGEPPACWQPTTTLLGQIMSMQFVGQQLSTITWKQHCWGGKPGIWIVAHTMFVPGGNRLPGGTE